MMNEWIISSSILIAAVLLGRFLLRGKISLRLQYGLWAVVLLRLLIPFQIYNSSFSTGTLSEQVDLSAPVRQVYFSANEEEYERQYTASYHETVRWHESKGKPLDPVAAQKQAAEAAQLSLNLSLNLELFNIWLLGMAAMASVIIFCNVHLALRLRRHRCEMEIPDSLLRVYITEAVPTPCIFGFFKPAIYLTPAAAKDPQVRAHVLEHELTHYRHLDHIWSVLRSVCLVLHWYNPLVWIAAKVSRADAELACDEGALKKLGENQRGDYGRTLISLTCADPVSDLFLTATTMTGSAGSLRERIKLLMKRPRNTVLTLTAVILLVTLTVGCTFASAPATTQPPETTEPAQTDPLHQTDLAYALPIEQAMEDYADRNPRRLTPEEISQANEAFASTVYDEEKDEMFVTAVAAFFTSDYEDVTELDFAEFLRYFPVTAEAAEEEFQLLRQKYGEEFDFFEQETLQNMPVPVHRYAARDIDAVTRRYANIPYQEILDRESVYYLEETDSYYNFTSDFGPGMFHCIDGFVYDGGAILYSINKALFLVDDNPGNNSIKAHLTLILDQKERVVTENDSFTADGLLVYPGTRWGMSEDELLLALNITQYGVFSGMRGIHLPDTTFCGYPASIAFYFEQYRSTDAWGLCDVTVRFEDEAAANEVYNILYEQLGKSDSWTNGVASCVWWSDSTLKDLISPDAWAVYQNKHTTYLYEGQSEDLIAASSIAWFGDGYPETENMVCFSSRLSMARQIEASLTPEFGTAAYFDALLNPQMYRSEADWYPRALTSFYENAGQIDLFQLFYGGIPGADNALTDAEREFLESKSGYDPELDVKRIPAAEMDRVLQEYFGTPLYMVEGIGLENFLYWSKTDCYYHCHSDSNLSFVEIVGCTEVEDGLWNITYTDWQGRLCVATLTYQNDTWKVLSNTQAA